jgi:hypothetical protein
MPTGPVSCWRNIAVNPMLIAGSVLSGVNLARKLKELFDAGSPRI